MATRLSCPSTSDPAQTQIVLQAAPGRQMLEEEKGPDEGVNPRGDILVLSLLPKAGTLGVLFRVSLPYGVALFSF